LESFIVNDLLKFYGVNVAKKPLPDKRSPNQN